MRQFNYWRIFFMLKPVIIYHAYDYYLQNLSFNPSKSYPVQTQLSNQGIPTQFLPWQETLQSQFILPLAAWDYANFYDEFTQWIKQHKNAFINPTELMLWNSHKGYLCDLQN